VNHSNQEEKLSRLGGLGPKSAQWLRVAGIENSAQLRRLGSVAAYLKVKRSGYPVSLDLRWALEGATKGESWWQIAKRSRASLLLALEQYEHNGLSMRKST
jgi:DNA transformation protein